MRGRLYAWAVVVFIAAGAGAWAAEITLPEASADHILFAQIHDLHPVDVSAIHGRVAYRWSSRDPGGGSDYTGFYYPATRDLDRNHTIEWYRANRPDWVVYECDRRTPGYDFIYPWGAYVPIDITRDDVRQYILNTFLLPAIARGYKSISLDNVTLVNGRHRCGTWHGSQWVQKYSGDTRDPRFTEAVLDYIKWLRDTLHAHGVALALNAKIDPRQLSPTRTLISLGDMWLEEGGVDAGCRNNVVDRLWHTKFDLWWWASQRHESLIFLDKTCTSPDQLSPAERGWIIANFLLVRSERSYLAVVRDEDHGKVNRYMADFDPPVGAAQGPPHEEGQLWVRLYQRGLVAVNPSSTAAGDLTLPPGRWTDESGTRVGAVLHMPPHSGSVLLRSGAP